MARQLNVFGQQQFEQIGNNSVSTSQTMKPQQQHRSNNNNKLMHTTTQHQQAAQPPQQFPYGQTNMVGDRNGKNALRTNASLIMNKNGTSTSSTTNIVGASNAAQATPQHSSGKASPHDAPGADFWKRHNHVFEATGDYYMTGQTPTGLAPSLFQDNNKAKATRMGDSSGHQSSDNGGSSSNQQQRDRMQHRLQRIREENQSPIQKLTHK